MNEEDQKAFSDLIVASTVLAQVTENAADILSEEFEKMVLDQVRNVREVLARCPGAADMMWNGQINLNDIREEIYEARGPDSSIREGVRVIHEPTGIGRESYSKATTEENRIVAEKALRQALEKRRREI